MALVKVYVILFRRPISSQEYAERARHTFGYGPDSMVVGVPPSDETFAKNAIREKRGDIWSRSPVPEVKIEKDDPQQLIDYLEMPWEEISDYADLCLPVEPVSPESSDGKSRYAVDFLKRKIAEGEDPDYFNVPGCGAQASISADRITGDVALMIWLYRS